MKRWDWQRLDSLHLRVAVVLLLGLLAAQWVSEQLYQEERERVIAHLIAGPLGQRLQQVAGVLARTPANERHTLLPLLNSPRITFELAAQLPAGHTAGNLHALRARLQQSLGPARRVELFTESPGDVDPPALRIAFTLEDGQVVIARHRYPRDDAITPSRHLPLLTGYFLAIALIALLALGWAVRPLGCLARAADSLGRNLSSAPLAETGPREVRQAAHAFNTMQNRLASYLGDRLRILAAVSHDLKTPITRLKLRAEMLPDAGLREKFLRDLEDMETMIGATLDFLRGDSRQENGVQVDINAMLSTLADDLQALGNQVEVRGQAGRPLLARPQALKRCLGNLLDNALRYGGNARISVEDRQESLTLHIDDDGPGIAEQDPNVLFEPFRRGESSRNRATGGTGLGLAIARDLARAHGGDVVLCNRAEGGLRATVTLPRGTPATLAE